MIKSNFIRFAVLANLFMAQKIMGSGLDRFCSGNYYYYHPEIVSNLTEKQRQHLLPELITGLKDNNLGECAEQVLIRMGPAATPALISALNNPDPMFRWRIIYIMSVWQPMRADAAQAIIRVLGQDENSNVQAEAAEALGKSVATPEVISALKDAIVRHHEVMNPTGFSAARSLRKLGAISALIEGAKDPNLDVRVCAIAALGDRPVPQEAIPTLTQVFLNDPSKIVQSWAQKALERTGSREVQQILAGRNQRERLKTLFVGSMFDATSILGGLSSLLFGLAGIWLGVKIITRKAFLISTKKIALVLAIFLGTPLIMAVAGLAFAMRMNMKDLEILGFFLGGMYFLWRGVAKSGILGTGLFVFNISGEALYESIYEALKKNNIEHEVNYPNIILKTIDSSIEVKTSRSGARLKFSNPQNIPAIVNFVDDIKTALDHQPIADGIPLRGIAFAIFGGIICMRGISSLLMPFLFRR